MRMDVRLLTCDLAKDSRGRPPESPVGPVKIVPSQVNSRSHRPCSRGKANRPAAGVLVARHDHAGDDPGVVLRSTPEHEPGIAIRDRVRLEAAGHDV